MALFAVKLKETSKYRTINVNIGQICTVTLNNQFPTYADALSMVNKADMQHDLTMQEFCSASRVDNFVYENDNWRQVF